MRGFACNKGLFMSEPDDVRWVPIEKFHMHTSVTAPLRDLGKPLNVKCTYQSASNSRGTMAHVCSMKFSIRF